MFWLTLALLPAWVAPLAYQPPQPLSPAAAAKICFDSDARSAFERHGISSAQWDTMENMARSLAAWNERINVVSRVDLENSLIGRHYLPSLALLNLFDSTNELNLDASGIDQEAATTVDALTVTPSSSSSSSSLQKCTVAELQGQLRARKLKVSGKKADLIARLEAATTVDNAAHPATANTESSSLSDSSPSISISTPSVSSSGSSRGGSGDVMMDDCRTLAGARIVDVGTGGGFPGLPLAVACPHAHFTLVDSRSKKLTVVRALVEEFQLTNVDVVHARVEDLPYQPQHFDFILGRAVTNLEDFIGWVQPFVRLDDDDDNGNVDAKSNANHGGMKSRGNNCDDIKSNVRGSKISSSSGASSSGSSSSRSPWGIGRGVLYVKSDDVAAALANLGLSSSDASSTPLATLLGPRAATQAGLGKSSSVRPSEMEGGETKEAEGEERHRELGYSSVLHVPSAAVSRARRRF